jgi:hypothetical protein
MSLSQKYPKQFSMCHAVLSLYCTVTILYCNDSYCNDSNLYCNYDAPKYEHMFTICV